MSAEQSWSLNPARPRYLYKYTSAETAATILKTGSLRWSSPVKFNDAFDVLRVVQLDYSERALCEALMQELVRLVEDGAKDLPTLHHIVRERFAEIRADVASGTGSFQAIADTLRQNSAELTDDFAGAVREVQEAWDQVVPVMRILCMTTEADSPQMWAYYADEQRGVVLEFEPGPHPQSPLLRMQPVHYQDESPKLFSKERWVRGLLGIQPIDYYEYLREYCRTKKSLWAHEKEWRVVAFGKGENATMRHADVPFDPGELKRIVYGAQISNSARRHLEKLRLKRPWQQVGTAVARIDHETRAFRIETSPAEVAARVRIAAWFRRLFDK